MATITLKNIPENLISGLKAEAKNNQRSLNGEILYALQLYLLRKKERPDAEEIIRKAKELRSKVKDHSGIEEITDALNKGRP